MKKPRFSTETLEKYENFIHDAVAELNQYCANLLGVDEYKIESSMVFTKVEGEGWNKYWLSFDKLHGGLKLEPLIVLFDSDKFPTSYLYFTENREGLEFTKPTHIEITHLNDLKAHLLKKDKKEPVIDKSKTYLMRDMSTGYIKIGKAVNPKTRERTLQAEKPTIEIIHIIEKNIERKLHKDYASKRIRGEWFKLTDEDVNRIITEYK